jgi:hypothetical protein
MAWVPQRPFGPWPLDTAAASNLSWPLGHQPGRLDTWRKLTPTLPKKHEQIRETRRKTMTFIYFHRQSEVSSIHFKCGYRTRGNLGPPGRSSDTLLEDHGAARLQVGVGQHGGMSTGHGRRKFRSQTQLPTFLDK